jgi:hypothetical protein
MSRAELARLLLRRARCGNQLPPQQFPAGAGSQQADREAAESLGRALRHALKRSGRSLAFLARTAGVPYASIHGFVHGKQDLHLRLASRLCAVLGLGLTSVHEGDQRSDETTETAEGDQR